MRKKIKLLAYLGVCIAIGYLAWLVPVRAGEPQNFTLTITIPADKVQAYAKYFLIAYPNQTANNEDPNKILTNPQWIRHRIFLFARNAYQKGRRIEFEELNQPVFDPDIVEGAAQ